MSTPSRGRARRGGLMTWDGRYTGKLSPVTVVETILVYVVAPLAVIAVLALLTLVPGRRKRPRYKPGQPWQHAPVWYEPHPEATGGGSGAGHSDGHAALGAGASRAAITSGASTGTATPVPGGPRGGARGTW